MTRSRARVLVLTPRFPYPPNRGDRLHAYHLIRVFASRFEVFVAALVGEHDALEEGGRTLREWGVEPILIPLPRSRRWLRLAGALVSGRPFQVAYYDEPAMRDALRELDRRAGPFDAVVCHLARLAPMIGIVRARVRVASLCDCLRLGLERRLVHAPLLERPSVWMEARRMGRYERSIPAHIDEAWLVSDVDLRAFGEPPGNLRVIPNGIDERLFEGPVPEEPPPTVGFLGHLGVPHNVDAAIHLVRDILPRLRAKGIGARVRLVGPEPAPALRALASLPDVELAGYVTDLRPALQGLRVMCAPLRFSAGLQNKLIEAIAAGVPAVSSEGAVQALGPEGKAWARSAGDAEGYATAIAELWTRSPDLLAMLSAGRSWARRRFRWEAYRDRLEALLDAESGPSDRWTRVESR